MAETARILTEEQKSILKQCLWDMNLTPEEFLDIIEGRSSRKWPERAFCVARLLESVNWFDIVKIIEPEKICRLWDEAKRYVRFKSIKEGMDFACRILQ
jgi:hypothetical protein